VHSILHNADNYTTKNCYAQLSNSKEISRNEKLLNHMKMVYSACLGFKYILNRS
jgi:hypothetical protein